MTAVIRKFKVYVNEQRKHCEWAGDDLAGAAIVVWDRTGRAGTSIWASGYGRVDELRVPEYVHAQLMRALTQQLAEDNIITKLYGPPDDGAS